MNKSLLKKNRGNLKELLAQCTEAQQQMFKRMYAYNHIYKSINDCVDTMDDDKVDWAMNQCQRTVDKNKQFNN